MSCAVPVHHPLYTQTVKNLERTSVRDKLLRLVQYFSRFLSYYFYRKGYSAQLIKQMKGLNSSLSMARKAFRIGKPLTNLKALLAELGNRTSDHITHATIVAKNVGSGLYLVCDSLLFLINAGALIVPATRVKALQDAANRFWLLAIVSGIVDAAYKSYYEYSRVAALKENEKAGASGDLATAEKNLKKQTRLLVWGLLDALIPLNSLGWFKTNDGLVGMAGTITAFMGLQDLW